MEWKTRTRITFRIGKLVLDWGKWLWELSIDNHTVTSPNQAEHFKCWTRIFELEMKQQRFYTDVQVTLKTIFTECKTNISEFVSFICFNLITGSNLTVRYGRGFKQLSTMRVGLCIRRQRSKLVWDFFWAEKNSQSTDENREISGAFSFLLVSGSISFDLWHVFGWISAQNCKNPVFLRFRTFPPSFVAASTGKNIVWGFKEFSGN